MCKKHFFLVYILQRIFHSLGAKSENALYRHLLLNHGETLKRASMEVNMGCTVHGNIPKNMGNTTGQTEAKFLKIHLFHKNRFLICIFK